MVDFDMNKLIYSLILSVFFLDFLHFNVKILPRFVTWLPDLLLLITGAIVFFRFSLRQYFDIDIRYIYCIIVYILVMIFGAIYNDLEPFKMVVGARLHLKHLAIFLLPAVYRFDKYELKQQLGLLLPLLLLQTPVAVFQKLYWVFVLRKYSGDVVQGTLFSANPLAVAMLCGIAILFAFYLKKEVSLKTFLISSICLFIPTTICESKATLFYLPIVLIVPSLFCGTFMKGRRRKAVLIASIGWIVCMSLFIPMYNLIISHERKDISNFSAIASGKYLSGYLYSGINERHFFNNIIKNRTNKDAPAVAQLRRIDQIAVAYKNLIDKSFINLMMGGGIGITFNSYLESLNARSSSGNRSGSDANSNVYAAMSASNAKWPNALSLTADVTISILLWEVGIVGIIGYSLFFLLLFRDSILLSKSSGIYGSFGLGWCAVTVVVFMTLGYFNMEHCNVINLLFWYFSGIVAARAVRLRRWSEVTEAAGQRGPGMFMREKGLVFE